MVASVSANGTVPMPIKKFILELDEIGYIGWKVEMRLNPRAEHFDLFLNSDDEKSWQGFSHIVLSWNFGDENGNALSLPKDGLVKEQLPQEVLWFIYNKYFEKFNDSVKLPKRLEETLKGTSQTDVSKQAEEKV